MPDKPAGCRAARASRRSVGWVERERTPSSRAAHRWVSLPLNPPCGGWKKKLSPPPFTGLILLLAWLSEGRLPETFGWRSEVRRPRAGFVTPHSGGPGTPPYGHYEPCARSSLNGPAATPGTQA